MVPLKLFICMKMAFKLQPKVEASIITHVPKLHAASYG